MERTDKMEVMEIAERGENIECVRTKNHVKNRENGNDGRKGIMERVEIME